MLTRSCEPTPGATSRTGGFGVRFRPEGWALSFAAFLNHWWNLPFLVMLGLCGAFFLLQHLGLVGADADHDVEAEHDVQVGVRADADGDADVVADADGETGGAGLGGQDELSFFGVS